MRHRQQGFSLLEMAIVIVIIGLIVGSVFSAQTLIRFSQIQSMLGEYDSNVKAVKEFQDKFLALPGDMNGSAGSRPQDMWGTDPGGCPVTPSDLTLKTTTCNGDGNGTIGSSDTSGVLSNTNEWFRAWQQLANAGFIPGKFTGTPGSGGALEARPGQNVPASVINSAGWTLFYYLQVANNANLWGDKYGHLMTIGSLATNAFTAGPVFTPGEALSIDQKIDDGYAGQGNVRVWRSTLLPNCSTDDGLTQASQTYAIAAGTSTTTCSLIFITGF